MFLATAFLLGLFGSLHCAGMCGPLTLAIPSSSSTNTRLLAGRLAYNAGRIVTYTMIGALFGLVGKTFALAGLQRWLSIGAGIVILTGLASSSRMMAIGPAQSLVSALKNQFGRLLLRRDLVSQLSLGLLNGLLPCGLVYAACAGATATGSFLGGVVYMAAFGLGTLPMMLALGLAGQRLHWQLRFKLSALVPACLLVVGALLILRGMSLGIPYVSPMLGCDRCH